jgi:hypothetical protein
MRRCARIGLYSLGVAALALTAGCESGTDGYTTEAAAQAACPTDEVVWMRYPGHHDAMGFYVTKTSWVYGGDSAMGNRYACLQDAIAQGITCRTRNGVPLSEDIATTRGCYNVPGKPKD